MISGFNIRMGKCVMGGTCSNLVSFQFADNVRVLSEKSGKISLAFKKLGNKINSGLKMF